MYEGYKKIYAAEEDPGTEDPVLNRGRSEGPYGIYGHYLEDLILESVVEIAPGKFTLGIGS